MQLPRLPSCVYAGEDTPHWHRPFSGSILIISILRRPTPTTSLNLLGVPRLATPQLFLSGFPDLTLVPSGRPPLFPLLFFSLLSSSFYSRPCLFPLSSFFLLILSFLLYRSLLLFLSPFLLSLLLSLPLFSFFLLILSFLLYLFFFF